MLPCPFRQETLPRTLTFPMQTPPLATTTFRLRMLLAPTEHSSCLNATTAPTSWPVLTESMRWRNPAKPRRRFVGINSNDPVVYENDSFEHMVKRATGGMPYAYLHDASRRLPTLMEPNELQNFSCLMRVTVWSTKDEWMTAHETPTMSPHRSWRMPSRPCLKAKPRRSITPNPSAVR